MFRIPRKGDRVKFWETDVLYGREIRVEAYATVEKRRGDTIHLLKDGDTRHYITPTRKMEIIK